MSVLERVGLAPKAGRRPRRSGIRLEGRGPVGPPPLTRAAVLRRLTLLVALVGLAVLAFPTVDTYEAGVVGEVWRGDDVVAPFDFPLRVPDAELEVQRDSIRLAEPPVFVERTEALDVTLTRLDTLRDRLSTALDAYVAWKGAGARGQAVQAATDSARFAAIRAAFPAEVTPAQWEALTASSAAADGSAPAPTRDGAALGVRVLREASRVARLMLSRGVANVPADSLIGSQLAVQREDPRVREERLIARADVLALDQAYATARRELATAFPASPEGALLAFSFLQTSFEPSLHYQREATARRLAEQMAEVRPTRGLVKQGYTIVRRGDVITEDIHASLRSLSVAQRERSGERAVVRTLLGQVLLCLAAYTMFFLYLYLLRRQIFDDFRSLALIALLFAIVVAGYALAARSTTVHDLAVPVALVSILLTILFDSRVGMFGTVALAVLGGLISGFDFAFSF
ncbi:MAG TPA: hypothetical protein VK610_09565, partial [Rhodothermales bacterium]|nr:hypothetical protein [Rhodothermales bacterium]